MVQVKRSSASRFTHSKGKKTHLPPGSVVYVGKESYEKTSISTIDYNSSRVDEKNIKNLKESFPINGINGYLA